MARDGIFRNVVTTLGARPEAHARLTGARADAGHHKADVFRGATGSWCWTCRCGAGANAGSTRTDRQWMHAAAVLHEAARADGRD